MKLFNSMGPNPRIVRMFIAEKGLDIETVEIDIGNAENRQSAFMKDVNPTGQCPALALDNGTIISEITAICDYLEEIKADPVLFGNTAEERAVVRMWNRRIDLNVTEPMADGFRGGMGHDFFKDRMITFPESSDKLITKGKEGLQWLDEQIAGRDYIAGDEFRMPDILLFGWADFFASLGIGIAPEQKNLTAWFERVQKRPSVAASA